MNHVSETSSVLSGRKVVAAMFALGIVATAVLWLYWNYRVTRFMPMQEALLAEFPDSSPRVDNSPAKMSGIQVLQVVMKCPFDPTDPSAETQQMIDSWMIRTKDIADRYVSLADYEVLAVHLYQLVEEQELRQKTYFRNLRTWQELQVSDVITPKRK